MTGPCPHYTHTDREVGDVVSHVCRDCLAPLTDCVEHRFDEILAELEEVSLEQLAEAELEPAPSRRRRKH